MDIDPTEALDLTKSKKSTVDLESKWLHGAPAKDLKARVELQFQHRPVNQFKKHSSYSFNDYDKMVDTKIQTVFDGKLNAEGVAKLTISKTK